MKIAIIGSNGYIAGALIKELEKDNNIEEIVKIDKNCNADLYLDLKEDDKFDYSVLKEIEIVIFTAAISGPDKCAFNFDECWKINVEGTKYFIYEAAKRECKVVFFSSDAVFGDIPGNIYTEESETKAETPYGIMKKTIEDEFKGMRMFKSLRFSYVISARDKFITYCLSCIRKGEVANIFHPFYRNCITLSETVDIVRWFVYHFDEYIPSVLNVAGQELVSRIRIADEINRMTEQRLQYVISEPEDDFFANRARITQMKSLYMKKYNILEDKTFTEKIQKELEEIR